MDDRPGFSLIDSIMNLGSRLGDDIERTRLRRQVNGLNLFYVIMAWGLIIPLYLLVPNCTPLIVAQFVFGFLYLLNLIITSTGHLSLAAQLTIVIFEVHLFTDMLATNALASPAVFIVVLYPLLAALVEAPIFIHLWIALAQVITLMTIHFLLPGVERTFATYSNLDPVGITSLRLISLLTIPLMAAMIMRLIYQENINARLKLKVLVKEIEKSNKQLERYAGELKNESQRLKAEVDIARKIQLMVLPTPLELSEISDLDISAIMRPADEVGGDYYDVFKKGETIYFGIGDVTDHGLSSGVIMMMAQTAVRMLLEDEPRNLRERLALLNRVLYANIKRTRNDRHMTLMLMSYQKGVFNAVGQHETVMILRQSGMVENIETLHNGFYIGMIPEVDPHVGEFSFSLAPGETLLLYSDGVTEAENAHKEQFGIQRLGASLKEHGAGESGEVMKTIMKDVFNFMGEMRILDDITLVVIKQR